MAAQNAKFAQDMIHAVHRAREAANGHDFGIFGLGIPGLFAPHALKFDPAEISAYFDDNSALWGTKVHDRPICGPDAIKELGISHVALSMSRKYADAVAERLRGMGITVYQWSSRCKRKPDRRSLRVEASRRIGPLAIGALHDSRLTVDVRVLRQSSRDADVAD
jgi:hypothetical protein